MRSRKTSAARSGVTVSSCGNRRSRITREKSAPSRQTGDRRRQQARHRAAAPQRVVFASYRRGGAVRAVCIKSALFYQLIKHIVARIARHSLRGRTRTACKRAWRNARRSGGKHGQAAKKGANACCLCCILTARFICTLRYSFRRVTAHCASPSFTVFRRDRGALHHSNAQASSELGWPCLRGAGVTRHRK